MFQVRRRLLEKVKGRVLKNVPSKSKITGKYSRLEEDYWKMFQVRERVKENVPDSRRSTGKCSR